jgi:hypothetical protein
VLLDARYSELARRRAEFAAVATLQRKIAQLIAERVDRSIRT